ncbi:transposase [Thermoplasmatales archaeon AK]|nr:transposase [Thermoplasmatales archaeon AK]
MRNGYYERDIGTRYGKINNLRVPRDRNNEFQTALFERYQRSIGIDDLVACLYGREYQQGRWQRSLRRYSTTGPPYPRTLI